VQERIVENYLTTLGVGVPASCRMTSQGSFTLDSESCVGVVQKHKLPFSKTPAKTQMIGANVPCLLKNTLHLYFNLATARTECLCILHSGKVRNERN
jgi:hypothetical protein